MHLKKKLLLKYNQNWSSAKIQTFFLNNWGQWLYHKITISTKSKMSIPLLKFLWRKKNCYIIIFLSAVFWPFPKVVDLGAPIKRDSIEKSESKVASEFSICCQKSAKVALHKIEDLFFGCLQTSLLCIVWKLAEGLWL